LASQVRIFQLARKLGLRSEALLQALTELGVSDVSAASSIDTETAHAAAELLAEQAADARKQREQREAAEAEAAQAAAEVAEPEAEPVAEPVEAAAEADEAAEGEEEPEPEEAGYIKAPPWAAPESLRSLEEQLAELELAETEPEEELLAPLPEVAQRASGERPANAIDVPPVVAVLGHVDHGKTTLLDAVRDTDVVSTEAGGITQHIGASEIQAGDRSIVFIDTPGHEAFTSMRARGGQVADIVVLIVAADDGVMPQTVEAIGHARAANVPIVVAINKTDMPGANPDQVKQQLLEHQLVGEDWGGDTIIVPISALNGENLDDLLEMILLVAEVQELWADPDAGFAGVVVEAGMDESRGPVATVLVRNGVIKVGDVVVCGSAHGRVRRLNDWRGKSVKEMGPGHPVEVIGLADVPQAGDIMVEAESVQDARAITEQRLEDARVADLEGSARASLRDLYRELGELAVKDLNLVLKADVSGSVQALEQSLKRLDTRLEEVEINIVHSGVGDVAESDVLLAVASEAIIIGFHVGVSTSASRLAEDEHVEIRTYDVIYEAIEDIQAAMVGMLEPIYEEQTVGRAEVRQLFRISRVGVVAGSVLTQGRAERGAKMIVRRDGEVVFEGTLESLRHFNENVSVLEAPNDCGIATSEFRGWQEGDEIEIIARVEVPRPAVRGAWD
jgi:translation initiation factor IF-2